MTNQQTQLDSNQNNSLTVSDDSSDKFTDRLTRYNALACSPLRGEKFNKEEGIADSKDSMKALKAQGGIQEMLAAQMTSIHLLQQLTVAVANSSGLGDAKQYYTNAAVKLTNCFTQQAALLAKLQGKGCQQIIVRHVEVHQGAQAIVGNINGVTPNLKEEK